MKKYIKNCILLAIPFGIYLLIVVIIDPYNYFISNALIDSPEKERIAENVEPHLYKLLQFQNRPTKNIALGDSRTNSLFKEISPQGWTNLAYGGGSLKEMIQTFWWVTSVVKPDTVLMGINLNLYNKYNKRFWVEETLERKKTFFSYAFSKYAFQSTLLFVRSYIFGEEIVFGKPDLTREEFWQFQIEQSASKFYEKLAYPNQYYAELKTISDYCLQNNIKLVFWIPPTHVEFQKRKKDFGLEAMDARFVSDLQSLGDLYNFDHVSEITLRKEDYDDPMHFREHISRIIFEEILRGKVRYARFSRFGEEKVDG